MELPAVFAASRRCRSTLGCTRSVWCVVWSSGCASLRLSQARRYSPLDDKQVTSLVLPGEYACLPTRFPQWESDAAAWLLALLKRRHDDPSSCNTSLNYMTDMAHLNRVG